MGVVAKLSMLIKDFSIKEPKVVKLKRCSEMKMPDLIHSFLEELCG
jgi:hypothetical protein